MRQADVCRLSVREKRKWETAAGLKVLLLQEMSIETLSNIKNQYFSTGVCCLPGSDCSWCTLHRLMIGNGSITHMDKLVLGVVLLGAALPVAVRLINGLRLLFALVFIQILTQVQDPSTVVLEKKEDSNLSEDVLKPLKSTNNWSKKHLLPESVVNMLKKHSVLFCISLILSASSS